MISQALSERQRSMEKVEIYKLFRDYVKHEDELINRRMSWNLTLHGFLFAAYGLSLQMVNQGAQPGVAIAALSLLYLLPIIGIVVAFLGWRSIKAAQKAIKNLRLQWECRISPQPDVFFPGLAGAGSEEAERLGMYSQNRIPVVIFFGWLAIVGISTYVTLTVPIV